MNKEHFFFFFFLSIAKGFSCTVVTAGDPQGSLDTVPSVAEGGRQLFVRTEVENPGLSCTRRWRQTCP